jgi:acyl-coenzyme A thioesterase PaaI-like protein
MAVTMSDNASGAMGPSDKPWSGGGREELTAAVRRLMTVIVTSAAPPEVLLETSERVALLANELDQYVPAPGATPSARFAEHEVHAEEAATLAAAMPFDMIVGSCNPVAPPITIEFEPPKAIGTALFTAPYEGAPGCVHGAALAGAFDIMLTAANFMVGAAGPTVELTIRYRRPTVISQPARFEAWVTGQSGRRTHSRGHLVQDGLVTVEAFGEFVGMDRSRIALMHRRGRRSPDGIDLTQASDRPGS